MVVLMLIVLDVANTHTLVTTVSGRPRPNTFFPGDWDLSGAAGRIYSIFDIVETGLNFAGVEEQSCRLRTACEVEQAVVSGAPQLPHHRLFTISHASHTVAYTVPHGPTQLLPWIYSVATVNTSVAPVAYHNVDVAAPVAVEAAVPVKVYTHAVPSVGVPPSTEMLIRTVKAAHAVQFTCVSHRPTVAGVTQTLMETDPLPLGLRRPRPRVRELQNQLQLCEVKKVNNPKKQEEREKKLPVCKS